MSRLVAANLFPVKGARAATAEGKPIGVVRATVTGLEYNGVGDRELFAAAPSAKGDGPMVITPRGIASSGGRENEHPQDRALKAMSVDITGERQVLVFARDVGSLAVDLDRPPVVFRRQSPYIKAKYLDLTLDPRLRNL